MPEVFRTRDCVAFKKGDTYTVAIDEALASSGWAGGQGVQWTQGSPLVPTVKKSDGYYAGFALWGSDESSDQYTAMTRQFPTYRFIVVGAGGWLISTSSYEKYTYASRQSGPLVPIVYHASDRLLFSLRGLWTKEDEFTLSGDPRAPNNYYIGFVAEPDNSTSSGHLTIQVSI